MQRLLWCLLTAPIILGAFQNCDNIKFRENSSRSGRQDAAQDASQMSGNGDGYGGKLTIYHHVDPAHPCAELGATGRPLPNNSIFLFDDTKAQVVREACGDIRPRALSQREFRVEGNGDLVYSSMTFQSHRPTEYEVAASACPAPLRPLTSPRRDNLIDNPLNLNLDPWGTLEGIDVQLNGSLAGLPSYLLTRNQDASRDPAMRWDQFVMLSRNTRYAFSFLARRGSGNAVRLMMFDQSPTLVTGNVTWSLVDGSVLSSSSNNLTQFTMTSRPVGDAFFYTVYFRTPNTVRGLDIGIAADESAAGSSIFATAAQLEDVSNFCGP